MPDSDHNVLCETRPNGSSTDEVRDELSIGEIYAVALDSRDQRPIFRLIHKNRGLDKAWVIQIPISVNDRRHVKAPASLPLSELISLCREQKIVPVQLAEPPIIKMNDDEIRAAYTNKDGRCPMLEHRNERYGILESLICDHSTAEILEHRLIAKWVKEQATLTKKARAKLYDILHSYWAGNFSKNALLPDYWRSGGKGQEREQKCKLGRPNTKVRADGDANKGYFLSDLDKQKLRLGWRYYLSEGRTRAQAYLETMWAFYAERIEIQDGCQVPILLHTDLRPTPAQFETWGPAGDPHLIASRIQLGEIDWAKKNRGISGTATDGIVAVGMEAVCDTTTNDAYLKSVTSRLKTVGPVNRLLITESRSNLIIGLHCSFDAPSARTFLLAVAHGASSKVDFCKRFGITIAEEDWPACVARTYLGDNGEYRNEFSREALHQFGASVDNIASGQPYFNGVAESKHHVVHARLDHTLDGTTEGKPRRRGQQDPAIIACVNYFEYMRELIQEILYHNNEEPVPHLLTAEMRRDGVKRTRIAIYRWLVDKGYVADFVPDVVNLRAHLYPSIPATLTESGVYLLREDTGDKAEIIPNARYMGECLVELGLLENARRKGNRRIAVRCDPTDPRSVWFQTELGLTELKNIHPDPILYNQAPLADLMAIKDEDKIAELENRGQNEQKRVAISAKRQRMQSQAQAEKSAEMAAQPTKYTKADHRKGMRKNRKEEAARLAEQFYQSGAQEQRPAGTAFDADEQSADLGRVPRQTANQVQLAQNDEMAEEDHINPALEALVKYMRDQDDR